MKEGIHPNYKQTTIKCACGNVIETFVPSVILSIPESRSSLTRAAVLISSESVTVWTRNNNISATKALSDLKFGKSFFACIGSKKYSFALEAVFFVNLIGLSELAPVVTNKSHTLFQIAHTARYNSLYVLQQIVGILI